MMTLKEKRFDAVALGELLIDFTQNGVSDSGNLLMEANPGGAPCNVLAMLCKFGKKQLLSARLAMICSARF
jgi:fructokinase